VNFEQEKKQIEETIQQIKDQANAQINQLIGRKQLIEELQAEEKEMEVSPAEEKEEKS